jgi:predicted transcriptional regulator
MTVTLIQETRSGLILSVTNLLSLEDVGITGGTYAIRELDEEHLEALALSDQSTWPPVLVTRCTEGYVLIGGYHRREVLKRKGIDEIAATCKAFENENDVVEAAFRDNLTHGLRANAQTRGDYAYWLFLTYPELSQTEIAKRVGISQPGVNKAIAHREKLARGEAATKTEEEIDTVKVCQQFVRRVVKFVDTMSEVDHDELLYVIRETIKNEHEKEKLIALNRVFTDLFGQSKTTLSQFRNVHTEV